MAALDEGQQYGLSTNFSSIKNKSVVHFKLTDTALKVIEEYLKNKSGLAQRPSIQFEGNHGIIQIPSRSHGDSAHTFQFSLSAVQGDPNGSFDCVQHTDTKQGQQLSLEGSMSYKVQVHATSDVFKTTRERMTLAEEESKKVCTKVIKQSGPHISRRKTTVLKNKPPQVLNQTSAPKPKPPNPPPVSFPQRPSPSSTSSSSNQGHSLSPHRHSNTPVVTSTYPKSSSPSLSSTTGPAPPKPQTNSAVMSMPYRDRIIHLLAIRPYKKPELLLRLKRDGIREKDKDSLGSILNSVADMKDNKYSLTKSAYCDVRPDWPFYTEDDRQILRKKLQSASPSSSPAPSHTSPESPTSSVPTLPPVSQKRPIEDTKPPHQAVKKPRISHYEKKKEKRLTNGVEVQKREASSTTNSSDRKHRKENIAAEADTSVNVASSTSETPEYISKYQAVWNMDQRHRYKQEFNQQYEEYTELHRNIEKVSKKFAELQILLTKTPHDTDEYENLKNKIRKEYVLQKSDPKYVEQKKRFEYLHGKLAHIKKLILDFDQQQVPVS